MNKQVKLALIGAGNRGQGIFGKYAQDMPHRAKFTAVVEPDRAKREFFASMHEISADRSFDSLAAFLVAELNDIDGVIIATLEDMRIEPILKSMERGWHILVEKPLCTNKEELIELYDATKDYENILIVCHQMRLTPIYKTIKSLVDSGDYGDIVCIQHSENLSWHHMAHSFVRGFFNNAPIGINIFDLNGKVLAVNNLARSFFGVQENDPLTGYCLFEDISITDETKCLFINK